MIGRLVALFAGLWLYGFSMAVMIRAAVGLDPWDVFHQGITRQVPMSFGTVTVLTGAVVLLAWIPLRQWPGVGTVSNVVCWSAFRSIWGSGCSRTGSRCRSG